MSGHSISPIISFVFLIVFMLNVSVNNFPVMSGRSHRFLGITSTFRGVKVSLLKETTRRRWESNRSGVSQLQVVLEINLNAQRQLTPQSITKTNTYNEHPLTPHFYIVKLGFTGVYIFFLFLLQNMDCGYSRRF